MTVKNYLVKNYGYDAGHSLAGILLALVVLLFAPAWMAGLLGGLLYAIPKELWDISKYRDRRVRWDNVADLVSYQTSWPAAYLAAGMWVQSIGLFALVAVVYLVFVWVKLND